MVSNLPILFFLLPSILAERFLTFDQRNLERKVIECREEAVLDCNKVRGMVEKYRPGDRRGFVPNRYDFFK
jgi:hypothetical protein